jgi:DNA-binding transcriptional ArsR family regulator
MTGERKERGKNRRARKKGRPGKRTPKAERPRRRRRPALRRGHAILAKAMAHPLRRLMLREINAGGAPRSPAQLAKMFDLPLAVVTYHATVLQRCGAVEVAAEKDG